VKRIIVVLVGIIAVAFAASAVASGKAPTVKLRGSSLGKILVNGRGRTAYMFTRDLRNRDVCAKINGCSSVWPALTVKGKPIAGPGLKRSLLGTIGLAGGVRQVTYAGHPLYTYSADTGPGQTDYVAFSQFGGTWYAVNSAGKTVR
jgi:predicted lipoprotein with Yx(FWY)xxD motif